MFKMMHNLGACFSKQNDSTKQSVAAQIRKVFCFLGFFFPTLQSSAGFVILDLDTPFMTGL